MYRARPRVCAKVSIHRSIELLIRENLRQLYGRFENLTLFTDPERSRVVMRESNLTEREARERNIPQRDTYIREDVILPPAQSQEEFSSESSAHPSGSYRPRGKIGREAGRLAA